MFKYSWQVHGFPITLKKPKKPKVFPFYRYRGRSMYWKF